MAGCLSGQLRPRNPELGDYIADEKQRRKEKGFTRQPERARGKERASERAGRGGQASAKAKEEERNHQRRMPF
jgi:hypothetical protein